MKRYITAWHIGTKSPEDHILLNKQLSGYIRLSHLPVIVSFGGINAAGRSSLHHGYRRLVINALDTKSATDTYIALARLMDIVPPDTNTLSESQRQFILDHTLIRKLESHLFDPKNIKVNRRIQLRGINSDTLEFMVAAEQVPQTLPENWKIIHQGQGTVHIRIDQSANMLLPETYAMKVNVAGQLPSGFHPENTYPSRHHPRGLQLAVYAASDAINALGIPWQTIQKHVPTDQISVYAGSAMGQLDPEGTGGLLQNPLQGNRIRSKNIALGFAEMAADFVNAYIIGNSGATGANLGACASFLYNLRQGVHDIQSGRAQVAIIGSSEAPLIPEVFEGYRMMSALAEDKDLQQLDGSDQIDYRRACRPFAQNCGFVLAESAQFIVLFADSLAVKLGCHIYGSIADVFVNADGYKKSISSPGIGNYLTVGKAMGSILSILGEDGLRHRSFVQAHGTGTPQNRTTESQIFSTLAQHFGIENLPITAVKAHIGHSLATAAGDQIIASLGVWHHGIIPGICTTTELAQDVATSRLNFLLQHHIVSKAQYDAAIINSKGFGGNNATAVLLSPTVTKDMLSYKHGKKVMTNHQLENETVSQATMEYEQKTLSGIEQTIYKFKEPASSDRLKITDDGIILPGQHLPVSLAPPHPYLDMRNKMDKKDARNNK